MKRSYPKDKFISTLAGVLCGIILALGIFSAFLLYFKPWRVKSHETIVKKDEKQKDEVLTLAIDPQEVIRPISRYIYGSSLTAKTEFEMDVTDFGKDTGITVFRYPGGAAEGYHWRTSKFDFNPRFDNAPLSNIDNVIKFCSLVGAKLVLQVNIESGTPAEAAAWVIFMNKEKGARVDYWELGNEVYGDWERNHMSGFEYAKIIHEYAAAMKAADPTIKIGANFGGPNYPDFDEILIREAADDIDFVSYHWYPNHTNESHTIEDRKHPLPEEVMANYLNVGHMADRIDKLLKKYAPKRRGKIEITFLEWDGSWDAVASDLKNEAKGMMWSLANAIFYADTLGQFALHGVTLANQYSFQEVMFGLIRGWDQEAGWGGSRWDGTTIRPKALALKLYSKFFGDIMIRSELSGSPAFFKRSDFRADSYTGEVPYVSAYASKFRGTDKLAIVLINKHPEKDFKVKIELQDFSPQPYGALWVLNGPGLEAQNDGSPGEVSLKKYKVKGMGSEIDYTIPAHSVNLLQIDKEQ
ncbi:MAG: hypothetical protein HZB36_08285 [Candidatus Omnitrophica bacterium]|nr:hypothetical protein [Candidatus Omnitrophota bacterium]